MAHIMTKRGSLDNEVTYELMCDTIADMANIESKYKTLGSVCIVLQGNSGELEVYIANSNKEWNPLTTIGSSGGGNASLDIHICTNDEIDSETSLPDIASPMENTIYFVVNSEDENNLYSEYIYVNDEWELIGGATIDISGKADKNNTVLTNSLSLGREDNTIIGNSSIALGEYLEATGRAAFAEGSGTKAYGYAAHTEGRWTTASGSYAHAEGYNTVASSTCSHAEGFETIADIKQMHVSGIYNKATADAWSASTVYTTDSSVIYNGVLYKCNTNHTSTNTFDTDKWTQSAQQPLFVIGNGNNTNSRSNALKLTSDGSLSIGGGTTASGVSSFAAGGGTTASGTNSHSEGGGTTASGDNSHAEGGGARATATQAHAEGGGTSASALNSHAEGWNTTASGAASHSEGQNTTASGSYAHAEGLNTQASGAQSHAEGQNTYATNSGAHAEGMGGTYTENGQTKYYGALGTFSHSEGQQTIADSHASHAEGMMTKSQTFPGAHSEGCYTTASGYGAHAEGLNTIASNTAAHAENYYAIASGYGSHAEGCYTTAAGRYSHVFGRYNIADSYSDWPEWISGTSYNIGDKVKRTITSNNKTTIYAYICKTANSDSSFSTSKWTDQDGLMNYIEIVGNGSSNVTNSNARSLDWDGNEYLKGNLYVNCDSDSTDGFKVATEDFVTTRVPTPPTTDGTYTLQVTVSSGEATYSWV